jgi:DNA repair protein RadD
MRKADKQELRQLVIEYASSNTQVARAFDREVEGAVRGDSGVKSNAVVSDLSLKRSQQDFPLFDYQRELVDSTLEHYENSDRPYALLLSLPTGAGKTRTAISFIFEALCLHNSLNVYWLAPTNELVGQAIDTARKIWSEVPKVPDVDLLLADTEIDESEAPNGKIKFVTIQSVFRSIQKNPDYFENADIVVFDEAHQVAAPTFETVFRTAMAADSYVLGLSATPGRSDSEESAHLAHLFGRKILVSEILKPNAISVLQRRGVLARIHFRDAEDAGKYETRFAACLEIMKEVIEQKSSILVFTESVAQAHAFSVIINQTNPNNAAVLHSNTPQDERQRIISAFSSGTLPVLLNQQILTTGYDSPGVRHMLLTSRIGSPVMFEQMVGRVARGPSVGGVANSYVWQFEDHLRIHGYPNSYHRYEDYEWSNLASSTLI